MSVKTTTTHTATCPKCRLWKVVCGSKAEAGKAGREHRKLHEFRVGQRVEVPSSGACRFATIKHLFIDQDRAIVEADPRRKVICYSCPHHEEHETGAYVSDHARISTLRARP